MIETVALMWMNLDTRIARDSRRIRMHLTIAGSIRRAHSQNGTRRVESLGNLRESIGNRHVLYRYATDFWALDLLALPRSLRGQGREGIGWAHRPSSMTLTRARPSMTSWVPKL